MGTVTQSGAKGRIPCSQDGPRATVPQRQRGYVALKVRLPIGDISSSSSTASRISSSNSRTGSCARPSIRIS
jgi:hypothetical protein